MNKIHSQLDADLVFLGISFKCTSKHRFMVRLSIDEEYFILQCNGEDIYHDSANEDCYHVESAITFFRAFIDENY